ncbi:MAG: hypothetical protein Q9M36_05860 [Sulfurovum sp.]|nr:hypothetical protein [Sulfurovum sp.]
MKIFLFSLVGSLVLAIFALIVVGEDNNLSTYIKVSDLQEGLKFLIFILIMSIGALFGIDVKNKVIEIFRK